MSAPFVPRGEVPQWKTLYTLLAAAAVDEIVTYEAMAEAIGSDKAGVQSAVRRAGRELAKVDKRAVRAVRNVGYRIVRPEEHLDLAKGQQRRSNRALKRGYSNTVNVDMAAMEPEVRKAFDVVATAFSMQLEFNRRVDVRQNKLQAQIEAMHPKVERTEAEVVELRERLERLENK